LYFVNTRDKKVVGILLYLRFRANLLAMISMVFDYQKEH
jgi:hypothetical protein